MAEATAGEGRARPASVLDGDVREPANLQHLFPRDEEALVLGANSELGGPPKKLLPGRGTYGGVVNSHIVHQDAPLILTVEAADVGQRTLRLEYDGDPVQLLVSRVKDVPRHGQTVAPQYRSNAATRFSATAWGVLPSI